LQTQSTIQSETQNFQNDKNFCMLKLKKKFSTIFRVWIFLMSLNNTKISCKYYVKNEEKKISMANNEFFLPWLSVFNFYENSLSLQARKLLVETSSLYIFFSFCINWKLSRTRQLEIRRMRHKNVNIGENRWKNVKEFAKSIQFYKWRSQ